MLFISLFGGDHKFQAFCQILMRDKIAIDLSASAGDAGYFLSVALLDDGEGLAARLENDLVEKGHGNDIFGIGRGERI